MSDKLNKNLRTYRYVPQTNIQTLSNPAGAVLIMGGSVNKHKYYLGFSILLVLARCRLPIYIHNLLEWAKQARHKLENSLGGSWIHYTYGHNMTCKGCQWMTEYWLGGTRSRYYQVCIAVSVWTRAPSATPEPTPQQQQQQQQQQLWRHNSTRLSLSFTSDVSTSMSGVGVGQLWF